MSNSEFYFVVLRKPSFYLLAMCVVLFVCVWISFSQVNRICATKDICCSEGSTSTMVVRQETLLDFLCPLSDEDYETLNHLLVIVYTANINIDAAKKNGIAIDYISNDEKLREALDLSKKLLSQIDTRIILPDVSFPFFYHSCQSGGTCQECFLAHFEDLYNITRLCDKQLSIMTLILYYNFVIHELQSDVDSMLQTLLLHESLCNSIQLVNLHSCVQSYIYYSSLERLYRPLETYPMKSQWALKKMLERVKSKVTLIVFGLVYNARNETLLACPLLLQSGQKEYVKEAMELVAYYNEIIENNPAFFDLEIGPIYNLNVNEIDFGEESLLSQIRFLKTSVQFYRDRYAKLYQHTCRLLSDDP